LIDMSAVDKQKPNGSSNSNDNGNDSSDNEEELSLVDNDSLKQHMLKSESVDLQSNGDVQNNNNNNNSKNNKKSVFAELKSMDKKKAKTQLRRLYELAKTEKWFLLIGLGALLV